MNSFVQQNSLILPIGTKISFKQYDKTDVAYNPSYNPNLSQTKPIRLINCSVAQKFYAILEDIDVDFEICCDNRLCPRGIRLTLIINENKHPFYIPPAKSCTFQALETDGRKLHFLSQNTEDDQFMVASTSGKHTSFDAVSVNSSKIIFSVEVEKCLKEQVFSEPFGDSLFGNKICVHIQTLSGKTTDVWVGINNTILDLKKLFAIQEGTSVNHTLIYNSVPLNDIRKLADYGIRDHCKLYVVYNPGFTPPVTASEVSDLPRNSNIKPFFGSTPPAYQTHHQVNSNVCGFNFSPQFIASRQRKLASCGRTHNSKPSVAFIKSQTTATYTPQMSELCYDGTTQLFSSEKRGVISYGQQYDQKSTSYDNFKLDYNLIVNSFVILMRTESNYG